MHRSLIPLLFLALLFGACTESSVEPYDKGTDPSQERIFFSEFFVNGDTVGLFSVRSDGSDRRLIAYNALAYCSPLKNNSIHFVSFSDNATRLMKANADGSNARVLAELPLFTTALFSRDGSKVLYSLPKQDPFGILGFSSEIHIMNADGSNDLLLDDNATGTSLPQISPDGSKVAYFRGSMNELEGRWHDSLYVCNIDGSNKTYISDGIVWLWFDTYGETFIEWSPDGRRILGTGSQGDNSDIVEIDIAGKTPRVISSGTGVKVMPKFSPDGSRIAYILSTGQQSSLIVMDANGGNQRPLATSFSTALGFPQWSSDGSRILFTELSDSTGMYSGALKYVEIASGAIRTITQNATLGFWEK